MRNTRISRNLIGGQSPEEKFCSNKGHTSCNNNRVSGCNFVKGNNKRGRFKTTDECKYFPAQHCGTKEANTPNGALMRRSRGLYVKGCQPGGKCKNEYETQYDWCGSAPVITTSSVPDEYYEPDPLPEKDPKNGVRL